jgi:hypothetical protein
VECANTDELFDVGESDGDEAIDGMDFKVPGFAEASQKTVKDITDSSVPPSANGKDFVLAARTTDSAPPKPVDAPTDAYLGRGFLSLFIRVLNLCCI